MESPFKVGDKVVILPHRGKNADGTVKDVFATVSNPCRLTDEVRLDGSPIGFYVDVVLQLSPRTGAELGYHAASLELAPLPPLTVKA